MRRIRVLLAVAAAFGLVAAACGSDQPSGQESPTSPVERPEFPAGSLAADIVERGEIVIGVKFDVPPFGFKNPQTDEVEGFDVDLGRHVANALGVEPSFVEAISDNRIPFLKDGTVDLILSTMTITTDRDAEIDFSEPYYIAHGRVLVREDSDITGIDDLAGRKVCTVTGSTYEGAVEEQAPEADTQLVDTYSECLSLIQTEAVEAVVTDDVILTGMIIQDPTLKLVGEEITVEPYGAGIKQGETELQDFVDEVIGAVKDDGRWADMFDTWIGQYTGESQDPPTMTLEEALELRPCEETC